MTSLTRTNPLSRSGCYKSILAIITSFTFVLSANASQCNYYIDATNGLDDRAGTTKEEAWQTISKVNEVMSYPGLAESSKVCFKRGEVWREQLTITNSGSAGNPIKFKAYGSGNNPLIIRSDEATVDWWRWWKHSKYTSGGFEEFKDISDLNLVDPLTSKFAYPWRDTRGSEGLVIADEYNAYRGKYAAKITRSGNQTVTLSSRRPLGEQGGTFYVSFYAKSEPGIELVIRIGDIQTSPALWLQPDDQQSILSNWGSSVNPVYTVPSSTEYTYHTLAFKTDINAAAIDIRFELLNGTGSAWVDEVSIGDGPAEAAKRVWAGREVNASLSRIYGLQDKGARVFAQYSVEPDLLNNLQASYKSGKLYLRRDDENLNDIEIGKRTNAILVDGQQYITVNHIDVMGAGALPKDVVSTQTGKGLIFINPGSSYIKIKNLTASLASGTGIGAGIFENLDNPSNITYRNVTTHGGQSTGLYLRGSGKIINSKIYDIANLPGDTGDMGGIGIQEGPVLIENNELYNIGRIDQGDIDAAITICCGLKGKAEVYRNYIHDIFSGGILIHGSDAVTPFDHTVAYNIINRYGNSQSTVNNEGKTVTTGTFAGIRLRDVAGTRIYNNVIANGGSNVLAKGLVLWRDVRDVQVFNNIFYENQLHDIQTASTGGEYFDTGLAIDNNLYWRTNSNPFRVWLGTSYLSLNDWIVSENGHDIESESEDPLFINNNLSSKQDFQLMNDSRAINLGIYTEFNKDIDYNWIYDKPDAGVYEF